METLAKRLKFYREKKGLSIREVARSLNVSPSTYRAWEYGAQIKGEPYFALAEMYDVSLTQLMLGKMLEVEAQIEVIEKAIRSIKMNL